MPQPYKYNDFPECDIPVEDILGCVGKPLVQFIPDTKEGREAALEARAGLLDMMNEQREWVVGEVYSALEYLDSDDIRSEIDIETSLTDCADKAFAHAAYAVERAFEDLCG